MYVLNGQSQHIQIEVLTITSEHKSSKIHIERKFQSKEQG